MSRYQSYLNSAVKIIEGYTAVTPLAIYLKKYFSEHKKYGSKDRKQVAALCYGYFRLGYAATHVSIEERILLAVFLCEQNDNELLHLLKSEWNEKIHLPIKDKLLLVKNIFSVNDIFPLKNELSTAVESDKFSLSFLIQPDLFARIRPGKKDVVIKKLEASHTIYRLIKESSIALTNTTKLDTILDIDKEVVIQDRNSQQVLNYLANDKNKEVITVWDCCAASGGKSILLYDLLNKRVNITVSDIRQSILSNLHERFKKAGINKYTSFVADCSKPEFKYNLPQQDVIICDVPCTGSGTWSRTPEQLSFFDADVLNEYSVRQKQIVSNVIPYIKEGGLLVYITCSVFKKENEEVIEFIQEKFSLTLLHTELLKGYEQKADSMFVTILQKE